MTRITTFAVAGLLALTGAASAAPQLERVRGTIDSADANSVTITTNEGKSETVQIGGAKFVWVQKSSLDNIKDGVFIGTATKGENPMTALEVVIFPDSMRGTGEGHYAWDAITDHTAAGGAKVKSAMTNGTVKSEPSAGPKVKSAMTNGTVARSSGASGEKMLTVTYDKEGSKQIAVPPQAPIVAFEPADKAILKPGSKIFAVVAKDGDKLDGKMLAVGKDGLTPPM
ncbi:metal ABC transporter permease [Methylobacterium planeticum]|uniref:Metal ABC transporter permease n=1 Tax=Methylobacterium planeticum TaxID=2615211 RepID=A0A6N6MNM8_9HYPH|nr:metal ABC transporter permease [Methylobacterium planeticum]KAB1071488.1 metal ABC transporter permease [Methylobacterium planeticum]